MEETLQTLGDRMNRMDLRFEQVDRRFEQIDRRFEQIDRRFEHFEVRLEQLRNETLIGFEQVQQRLTLILERFDDFIKKDEANLAEHSRIDKTHEAHDLRILALEHPDTPKRRRTGDSRLGSVAARMNRQKGGK